MKLTTALLVASMLLVAAARAQPLTCFPPPIDTCGKGVVRGTTERVEWMAWWVESNFEWRRVHGYRLLDEPAAMPAPGASSARDQAGFVSADKAAARGMRSCDVSPHKEALAACRALILASDRTMPPAILYNVDRAIRKYGTRPGFRINAIGALVPDGRRHRAGAWCECWRGAMKAGTVQYCLVTQTASYAACQRVQ